MVRCAYTRAIARRYFDVQSLEKWDNASSSETTSPYFESMSRRLASCGSGSRSPTASRTTIVRNPYEQASTAEARTHPEVVHPAMMTVSTPQAVSVAANAVPKKALAAFFDHTISLGSGCRRESTSTMRHVACFLLRRHTAGEHVD